MDRYVASRLHRQGQHERCQVSATTSTIHRCPQSLCPQICFCFTLSRDNLWNRGDSTASGTTTIVSMVDIMHAPEENRLQLCLAKIPDERETSGSDPRFLSAHIGWTAGLRWCAGAARPRGNTSRFYLLMLFLRFGVRSSIGSQQKHAQEHQRRSTIFSIGERHQDIRRFPDCTAWFQSNPFSDGLLSIGPYSRARICASGLDFNEPSAVASCALLLHAPVNI